MEGICAFSAVTDTFAAYYDGAPAGYYELYKDDTNSIKIAYIGLLPAFIGRGFGGALLTNVLEEVWLMSPERVWVHTWMLDHPSALCSWNFPKNWNPLRKRTYPSHPLSKIYSPFEKGSIQPQNQNFSTLKLLVNNFDDATFIKS